MARAMSALKCRATSARLLAGPSLAAAAVAMASLQLFPTALAMARAKRSSSLCLRNIDGHMAAPPAQVGTQAGEQLEPA